MSVGQVGMVMCERFSEEVDGGKWYLVQWDGMEGCPDNETIVFLNNGGPRYSPQNPPIDILRQAEERTRLRVLGHQSPIAYRGECRSKCRALRHATIDEVISSSGCVGLAH